VSDFDFGMADGHAPFSDGDFLGHFQGDLTDPHGLSAAHDGHDLHGYSFDLAGADPDEQGLWDQLQLDQGDGGNPYTVG
jgi:hypothetical protein